MMITSGGNVMIVMMTMVIMLNMMIRASTTNRMSMTTIGLIMMICEVKGISIGPFPADDQNDYAFWTK